jgi:nucleotide-binding universal stress UspA family protein
MDITAVVMPSDFNQKLTENAEKRLAALAKQHVPDDIPTQYWVRDGRVYREILAVAKEISADLIVLASHRPSLQDYLLGANAAKVVRHADCSVLVVRE